MNEFYEQVSQLGGGNRDLALTVLEGESCGQKALVKDDVLVWTSMPDGFFQNYTAEIKDLTPNRINLLGGIRVFADRLGREKKLVICGGGHVSMPIIRIGREIGFYVTVLEDRPKFADNARRAGADEVICEPFDEGLSRIPGDSDTFFVIVTRGHTYDMLCLREIAKKPYAYLGMMGSKRRVAKVKETMLGEGVEPKVIEDLYAPIGLSIGAETPEEIAVSVMAQIIEVKNKQHPGTGFSGELLQEILSDPGTEKVLATIVSRKGSAPRAAGTKMLVFPDGRCVDTIGGGCIEAEILQKALLILRGKADFPSLVQVDLTGEDAEKEGMVCGGTVEVFLEKI